MWEDDEFASAVTLAAGLVDKVEGQQRAVVNDVSAALGGVLAVVGGVLDATTGRIAVTAAAARGGQDAQEFQGAVTRTAELARDVSGVVARVVTAASALHQPGSPPLRIESPTVSVVALSEHAEFANETNVRNQNGEALVDGVGRAAMASAQGLGAKSIGVTVVSWKIDPSVADHARGLEAASFV